MIIVTGSGDSFCTGTDLKELNNTAPEARFRGEGRPEFEEAEKERPKPPPELARWWFINQCPKPVICALNGMAVGMGAEFVTMCDVRILSTEARVNWIFGKRGLVPDTGAGSWLLPHIVGYPNALRLLFTAEFFGADHLKEIGFAHEVVEHCELMEAAKAEARRYLDSSPLALSMMKRLTYLGLERTVAEHMETHLEMMKVCFASADHHEGVASFIERRPAVFTGAVPDIAKDLKVGRLLGVASGG